MEKKGQLYIVSTPIGNLGDITLRALETLKQVDLIAAEDTRKTKKLLFHYKISKPLTSYYSYNEKKRGQRLLTMLKEGSQIAVVTDSGTPGIQDPSFYLIQQAIESDILVTPIPGPTAAIAGLIASGLCTDRFVFEGFLPIKKGKKTKRLEQFACDEKTVIFYESPHRIEKTLTDIQNVLGDRKVALAREITKKFEEIIRGSISEVLLELKKRKKLGELTIILEGVQK